MWSVMGLMANLLLLIVILILAIFLFAYSFVLAFKVFELYENSICFICGKLKRPYNDNACKTCTDYLVKDRENWEGWSK